MTKISKDSSIQHLIHTCDNTFKYLDDILAPNNDDFRKGIYPAELTFHQANTKNEKCPYLDLDMYISSRRSVVQKYIRYKDIFFNFYIS